MHSLTTGACHDACVSPGRGRSATTIARGHREGCSVHDDRKLWLQCSPDRRPADRDYDDFAGGTQRDLDLPPGRGQGEIRDRATCIRPPRNVSPESRKSTRPAPARHPWLPHEGACGDLVRHCQELTSYACLGSGFTPCHPELAALRSSLNGHFDRERADRHPTALGGGLTYRLAR